MMCLRGGRAAEPRPAPGHAPADAATAAAVSRSRDRRARDDDHAGVQPLVPPIRRSGCRMLGTPAPEIMTVQSLEILDATNGETMQNIGDKAGGNDGQQQITASKNGHISFSVASLLADTRPTAARSPSSQNVAVAPSSSPAHHSSDEEYDSNQEDSIVDVEDLNSDQKSDEGPSKDNEYLQQRERERDFAKESVLSQGPIRPTPFSALAAAVYQATHPNWPHQGLVNPFGGPGPVFQGASPFGVPNMNAEDTITRNGIRVVKCDLCFLHPLEKVDFCICSNSIRDQSLQFFTDQFFDDALKTPLTAIGRFQKEH
ncbi:hypothetical protein NQ318_003065 [Aromia moschata]|uniref:Uncharacterized protein n=1 Tax=Aromia moschata TaxID=1265417 RepID=A0AAV8Y4G9_9CUCU|nr:hypothetical protein NQ318_003065 [Aromia moschata]